MTFALATEATYRSQQLHRAAATIAYTHTTVCLALDLRAGDTIRFRWQDDSRLLNGTIAAEACGCRDRRDGRRALQIDKTNGQKVEPSLPGRDHLEIQTPGRIAFYGVPLAWCVLPAAILVPLFETP